MNDQLAFPIYSMALSSSLPGFRKSAGLSEVDVPIRPIITTLHPNKTQYVLDVWQDWAQQSDVGNLFQIIEQIRRFNITMHDRGALLLIAGVYPNYIKVTSDPKNALGF